MKKNTLKKSDKEYYIDEMTLGEVYDAVKKAYLDGWESDDSFLLAVDVKIYSEKMKGGNNEQ